VILVALGADYNIFIMSRIREEADAGHEIHHAVSRGLSLTGRVITSAGVILAGTFAALLLAPLPNLRQIGFGVTVGILIDTFVVRSLLVPAATMVVGRWAFWPRIPEPRPPHDDSVSGVVAGPATIDNDTASAPERERELVLQ
jgi:RND superfamily putative drug exporter